MILWFNYLSTERDLFFFIENMFNYTRLTNIESSIFSGITINWNTPLLIEKIIITFRILSNGCSRVSNSAELVLLDLLFTFQEHSFPLNNFLLLLATPQTRLFVIHRYIISFLNSNNLSFSDSNFIENLSFLEVNGFLPAPADIPKLYHSVTSFWRS